MEQSTSTPYLQSTTSATNEHTIDDDEDLMTRYETNSTNAHSSGDSRRSTAVNGSNDETTNSGISSSSGWLSAAPISDSLRSGHSSGANVSNADYAWSRNSSTAAELETLQKEKRQLHVVLKAYERYL